MSWTKQNVASPIPQGLTSLLQGFGTVISSLNSLLSVAQAAVDVAQVFFTPTTNPYASIVGALLSEAQAFNNDLFATGVYYLSVNGNTVPGNASHNLLGLPTLTPRQAIQAAINSFGDLCDTARPQFSNIAEVTAIGLLATAPSPDQFIALIQGLLNILSLPDWESFLNIFQRINSKPTCEPTPPIWASYKLNSIQNLKDVQDTMNNVISALAGYQTTGNNVLTQLANVIAGKHTQLTLLQNQINQLVNNLRSGTGIYVMNLAPTIGGNVAIQNALMDCPLEQSTNQYTIMTLIVGGAANLVPVNLFRQMVL